jgi:hypothetical protein
VTVGSECCASATEFGAVLIGELSDLELPVAAVDC